jgi:NAD(P)H dehydrogenase (quinone)
MQTLFSAKPIPYRKQNHGDYAIPSMQLRPELGDPGALGFALHVEADPAK